MEERVDVFFNILFFLELTTCLPETSRIHNNVNKTQDEIQQKKKNTIPILQVYFASLEAVRPVESIKRSRNKTGIYQI